MPTPSRPWSLLLAAGGGVLTWTAFPDRGWWGAAYLGVAALVLASGRDSARWNALVGLVWGLGLFVPTLSWSGYAVGAAPWLLLAVTCAGYVALWGAAWSWARRGEAVWRTPWLQALTGVLVWLGTEQLRSSWPFGGFPWARLAFSQVDSPLGALAWAGGAPLVSGAVVLVGFSLARALVAARRVRPVVVGAWLGLAGTVLLAGFLVPLDTRAEAGTLRVAAVQGNVPDAGLEAFDEARLVLDNHVAGTHALLDRVAPGDLDLVLWPENGSDIDPRQDAAAAAAIDGAAAAVGAPVLVGTMEYPETGGRYNVSLLWQPGQGVVARYAKQRPAAFAEYVPLRALARRVSAAADLVRTDMLAGDAPGVIDVDVPALGRTVTVGTVICFEVAYDPIVRSAISEGGEVLVVQTNNANFGRTAESTQQLAMTRLRAIEHGRAAVQVSTVGVSAVVQPNGTVVAQTGLFTPDQLLATLPLRQSLTPATRWGGALAWIVSGLAVAVVVTGAAGAARVPRSRRDDAA